MPAKVQRDDRCRRVVLIAAALAVWPLAAAAHRAADVRGHLTLLEKGNRPRDDVGTAVIWLEGGAGARRAPVQAEISTAEKAFSPHVLVLPVGSTVAFPNHDPFNHNVFSLSKENPFDLGLYGRGARPKTQFSRPGIVSVYCNVHAQMSAVVIAIPTPYYAISNVQGEIVIPNVNAGHYLLHIWHEGIPPDKLDTETREVVISERNSTLGALKLPASSPLAAHKNKYGRDYDPPTPSAPGYDQP